MQILNFCLCNETPQDKILNVIIYKSTCQISSLFFSRSYNFKMLFYLLLEFLSYGFFILSLFCLGGHAGRWMTGSQVNFNIM